MKTTRLARRLGLDRNLLRQRTGNLAGSQTGKRRGPLSAPVELALPVVRPALTTRHAATAAPRRLAA